MGPSKGTPATPGPTFSLGGATAELGTGGEANTEGEEVAGGIDPPTMEAQDLGLAGVRSVERGMGALAVGGGGGGAEGDAVGAAMVVEMGMEIEWVEG